jgi:hypothetical protein
LWPTSLDAPRPPAQTNLPPATDSGKPAIKGIRFSNIFAESESGILIYGTETGGIQDLAFDRIKLRIKGGASSDAVGGNFDLRGSGGGLETAIFKHDIPGMYCQYVDGLQIHGFDLEWEDNLPDYFSDGIHCEHFNNLTIDGFKGQQAQKSGGGAKVALRHGSKLSIRNCEVADGTGTFLSLEDVKDQRLFVNNDLSDAKQATEPAKLQFKTSFGNRLPATRSVSKDK